MSSVASPARQSSSWTHSVASVSASLADRFGVVPEALAAELMGRFFTVADALSGVDVPESFLREDLFVLSQVLREVRRAIPTTE